MTQPFDALLVATRNRGKLSELSAMLQPLGVRVLSLDDVPALAEVVEDRDSFEGNASKKAIETCRATGLPTVADDSGLCVDALGGAPGVRSARYAGPTASDADNNQKLLAAMAEVPDARRSARFVAVIALCLPARNAEDRADHTVTFRGSVEGTVLRAPRGTGGFGYDPLFAPHPDPGAEPRAMAELSPAEKHRISHRGRAMRQLLTHLRSQLNA